MEDDSLTHHLQPHLKSSAGSTGHHSPADTSADFDNPALALSDGGEQARTTRNWERFDDDESVKANEQSVARGADIAGSARLPAPLHPASSQPAPATVSKVERTAVASHPVYFDCRSGEAVVVAGDMSVDSQGASVISTRHIPERWREKMRPLRAREIKLLKAFSIVAVLLFFPTGIPAVVFAWRTRREFDAGILRGDMERALRLARRTKALIVLSAVLAITAALLAFALVQGNLHGYDVDTNYLGSSSASG